MDQDLFERFQRGDRSAETAVRNHLRAVAARVIEAPHWGIEDPLSRRQLEQEAAEAAMRADGADAVSLATSALFESGLRGLQALRAREGIFDVDHPEAMLIMRVALETASRPQAAEIASHTEACAICRRHLEDCRRVLRAATTASAMSPALSQDAQALKVGLPGAPPTPPIAPKPRIQSFSNQEEPAGPGLIRQLLPALVVLACVGGIWWSSRPTPEQIVLAYAHALPLDRPPSDNASALPDEAAEAARDASRGRCGEAAETLSAYAKDSPDLPWLRYYEGLAWICLRDGAPALDALKVVEALPEDERPFGFDWWMAQALLLEGQSAPALARLDKLVDAEHARAKDAAELSAKIRKIDDLR